MNSRNLYDADDERDGDDIVDTATSENSQQQPNEVACGSGIGREQNVHADQKCRQCGGDVSDFDNSVSELGLPRGRRATEGNSPLRNRNEGRRGCRKILQERTLRRKIQGIRGDKFGVTPLHIAVERRSVGLVKMLVNAGADVNAQDNSGRSPMHIACEMDRMDLLQALLGLRMSAPYASSFDKHPMHHVQRGRVDKSGRGGRSKQALNESSTVSSASSKSSLAS